VTLGRLAYAHVVHPLYHFAKRDGVNRAVRELRRNQWLAADAIDAIQHEKLRRILVHAHRHVPYYRDAIDALGVAPREVAQAETFARLPVLTKATIRRNHDRLQTTALTGNRLQLNSTSGSTGEPLKFYTDDRISTYLKGDQEQGVDGLEEEQP
jgi:phenylacetate-CoA ligase